MTKVLVLGGGLVGSVIALDLVADPDLEVCIADIDASKLEAVRTAGGGRLETITADCSDVDRVKSICSDHDLVVGAMPGRFGFATLRAVIESGRNYCDISFMPEDAWALDDLAREHGATCVVDIGVAPGMSNLFAGLAARRLEPCRSLDIYVGGIPAEPRDPFRYKAGFSPADVLEEYIRPARLVEDGKTVIRDALSEPEPIGFPGVGMLEAFNTDGLRSLAETLDVPFMREKTLRYPGHREVMLEMREAGFFSLDPIQVGDVQVRPRDVAAALLFPHWTYEDGEADLTVMRISGTGTLDGRPTRITWDLLDRYDPETGFSSMSRTTAFPCSIMARLIARGVVNEPGVHPPEQLADRDDVIEALLSGLQDRGVVYSETVEPLGPDD